jgi:hypothetical protein
MAYSHFSLVAPTLRREYEDMIQAIEQEKQDNNHENTELQDEEMRWARRHLLLVEKQRIIESFHEGRLSQKVYDQLLADLDARLLSVETEL